MKDFIFIKCLDDMEGYPPYKVYEEDDWMVVMYNDDMHDLNIWLDDDTNEWQWAIYPMDTVAAESVANGKAKEVFGIEYEP